MSTPSLDVVGAEIAGMERRTSDLSSPSTISVGVPLSFCLQILFVGPFSWNRHAVMWGPRKKEDHGYKCFVIWAGFMLAHGSYE